MGTGLSAPVETVSIERHGAASFRVGVAEMTGWRSSMEDAHVVHASERQGFFGVFDGHGGCECSEFIARRLREELQKGCLPIDDDAVRSLMLRLDEEFLKTSQKSGSTGTFLTIELDAEQAGRHRLRVGNVGDSRILLGRADGTIVNGLGTDCALTRDHKPDSPEEKERIERTGNCVRNVDGISRVNGELAVARAFGDAKYKTSQELPPEAQAVTADPELFTYYCERKDFVMLVCDGISEGQFPNAEVVALAASQLQEHGDPGKAAAQVCRTALKRNSKDNLTCMIVLLSGGELAPARECLPGPYSADESFSTAYEAAAKRGGLSLAEAVEKRYEFLTKELDMQLGVERREELETEKATYDQGPPTHLIHGSEERLAWFSDWVGKRKADANNLRPIGYSPNAPCFWQSQLPQVRSKKSLRFAKVPPENVLRPAIEEHPSLKWEDDGYENICSMKVEVLEDDPSDGTSKVFYAPNKELLWLPTAQLIDILDGM